MKVALGELIDRLSICNIKLYMVQERVHEAADSFTDLDRETVKKLKALNLERNRLMTAIEEALAEAVRTGEIRIDPRVKMT